MNRRSFLKASASAAVMASAGGYVARDALSLSEHVEKALGLHDVIYNVEPMSTPFASFDLARSESGYSAFLQFRQRPDGVICIDNIETTEEGIASMIRECWDNGGEPQLITFEDE